jgi:hypothetical protein
MHFYSAVDDQPSYFYDAQNPKVQIKMESIEAEEQKEQEEKKAEAEVKPKKKRGGSNRGTNLYGRAYCPGRFFMWSFEGSGESLTELVERC